MLVPPHTATTSTGLRVSCGSSFENRSPRQLRDAFSEIFRSSAVGSRRRVISQSRCTSKAHAKKRGHSECRRSTSWLTSRSPADRFHLSRTQVRLFLKSHRATLRNECVDKHHARTHLPDAGIFFSAVMDIETLSGLVECRSPSLTWQLHTVLESSTYACTTSSLSRGH